MAKIAIDISQSIYGTGVSTYTKKLVEALLKIDPDDNFVLFGGSLRRFQELKNMAGSFRGNFSPKIFAYPPAISDLIWNRLHILPVEKMIGEIDIIHTSDWVEPPARAPKVTTVHDLYPFKFPKLVHPKILEVHKRKMSWVAAESKRIIVPSSSTKNDLMQFGIKDELIRVIPEAPSLTKSSEAEVERVKRKFNLKSGYLISIGITPLKNTLKIIDAFNLARPGKDLKLVLVGKPVNVEIKEQRNLRILGHVSPDDLSALLTGSKGLVFASLYEGYGLPILDAFACGVPVVASGVASMPEVSGNAAVLVDPASTESIAEGIEKILRAPKSFVEKGLKRVSQFSWEKTAEETLKVYGELL